MESYYITDPEKRAASRRHVSSSRGGKGQVQLPSLHKNSIILRVRCPSTAVYLKADLTRRFSSCLACFGDLLGWYRAV
jgi:hypothetical protein